MSRRFMHLISLYQDMRDRYGADDPMVIEVSNEAALCESEDDIKPASERRGRQENPKFWNRKAPREITSLAA